MATIKFELSKPEYKLLAEFADDGKHQEQTPDELAHDILVAWLVAEQAKERP